ncbi:hypothetical protein C9I57_02250 [Trinickia symbiotica]|uniref:Uncharacterized protein n=1 Tax=Trinickia symbiotica TaxID=863227 RepID=A0A2T3Y1J5_9BURK|nr:hypothetical protein C9I57_02250 [Trinickia symbiotica]
MVTPTSEFARSLPKVGRQCDRRLIVNRGYLAIRGAFHRIFYEWLQATALAFPTALIAAARAGLPLAHAGGSRSATRRLK